MAGSVEAGTMTMHGDRMSEAGHDGHLSRAMQSTMSSDCCDGERVCSLADCATPVDGCSMAPFVLQMMSSTQSFVLALQRTRAASRRLFRPPIAA